MKIILVFLLLAGTVSAGQKPPVRLRGTFRTDLSALHGIDNNEWAGTGSNLFTLNIKTRKLKRIFRAEAELDAAQYYGATADQAVAAFDSSLALLFDGPAPATVGLRKGYLSLYTRYADISIGRQIINFGKGFVFSPIDMYSTVDITDLSFRRAGSDAARVRIPLGALSGVDMVTALTDKGGAPAAVKAYTNIHDWDVSLTGIYKRNTYETYAGISFKGDLILGVYGELVQHFIKDAVRHDFKGMLGLDYSIGTAWTFMTEYFYRENPSLNTAEALYGRHNLFSNIQYSINELMNVSANTLVNLDDGISLSTVQYFYNLFQNTDAVLYIHHYEMGNTPWAAQLPYTFEYGTRITIKSIMAAK